MTNNRSGLEADDSAVLVSSRFARRYLDAGEASQLFDELVDWVAWWRDRYHLHRRERRRLRPRPRRRGIFVRPGAASTRKNGWGAALLK